MNPEHPDFSPVSDIRVTAEHPAPDHQGALASHPAMSSPLAKEEILRYNQLLDEKPEAEQSNAPSDRTSRKYKYCLVIAIFMLVALVFGLVSFYCLFHKQSKSEIISAFVPQPFTENNDFVYFHLPNKLKVMLVKPNSATNHSFVCKINSTHCRRRIRA